MPDADSHAMPAPSATNAACDILMLVEDPGAANYVAALPHALAGAGIAARLFAGGFAADQLRGLDIAFAPLAAHMTAERLLDAHRPRLLLVGTSEDPDALGLALIDAARRRGIASVGVVDGAANPGLRFRGRGTSATAHAPDWLLVADRATSSAYAAQGFDAARIHVCGHPHFDAIRATRRALDAADRVAARATLYPGAGDRPVIVFLAEVSTGLDPVQFRRRPDYTLAGSGASDLRTHIVLDEFVAADTSAYTVLRLHPKDTRDDYAPFFDEFDVISAGGPVAPLLHAADLVVGMTSIALVEAALLGRPTLSILPRPGESEWLPTIASGVTPMVCRRCDIAPALRALIGATVDEAHIDALMPPGAEARVGAVLRDLLGDGRPA